MSQNRNPDFLFEEINLCNKTMCIDTQGSRNTAILHKGDFKQLDFKLITW